MGDSSLISDFARIVGWEGAMLISQAAGGQVRRLPMVPTEEHWLVDLLGIDRARRLCEVYGGTIVSIPKGDADVLRFRNHQIRAQRRKGVTIRQLAVEHRLTERQIYAILGSVEE